MAEVTLEQINRNVLLLKEEVDDIKEMLEESAMEVREEVKTAVADSRRRPVSEFKSQKEIEKKFL